MLNFIIILMQVVKKLSFTENLLITSKYTFLQYEFLKMYYLLDNYFTQIKFVKLSQSGEDYPEFRMIYEVKKTWILF